MSRVKLLIVIASVLLAESCSVTAPFVDRRREAGVSVNNDLYVGASKIDKPAVCYNALTTPYSEVLKLATQECIKHKTGTVAVPVKQTSFTCRLLIPNHFYFQCTQ